MTVRRPIRSNSRKPRRSCRKSARTALRTGARSLKPTRLPAPLRPLRPIRPRSRIALGQKERALDRAPFFVGCRNARSPHEEAQCGEGAFTLVTDFVEPVIGRRLAPTRWLDPG